MQVSCQTFSTLALPLKTPRMTNAKIKQNVLESMLKSLKLIFLRENLFFSKNTIFYKKFYHLFFLFLFFRISFV